MRAVDVGVHVARVASGAVPILQVWQLVDPDSATCPSGHEVHVGVPLEG